MSLYLSIIIPAHNEEQRLPSSLEQVNQFLDEQLYPAEILVVENGSQDRTLAIAQEYARRYPRLRVFHEDGRGKGLAVRRGMLEALGAYRFMCDADLSMPIAQVQRFLPPVLESYDVALGSREAPGAVRYQEAFYRHWGGRAINSLIRLLALPGLRDTQCGFKCFTASVARDLFQVQTLQGWSFDIELLYVARMRGYRVVEVPIDWYYNPQSKVHPVSDALKMLRDLVVIRRNASRGIYDLPAARK